MQYPVSKLQDCKYKLAEYAGKRMGRMGAERRFLQKTAFEALFFLCTSQRQKCQKARKTK